MTTSCPPRRTLLKICGSRLRSAPVNGSSRSSVLAKTRVPSSRAGAPAAFPSRGKVRLLRHRAQDAEDIPREAKRSCRGSPRSCDGARGQREAYKGRAAVFGPGRASHRDPDGRCRAYTRRRPSQANPPDPPPGACGCSVCPFASAAAWSADVEGQGMPEEDRNRPFGRF